MSDSPLRRALDAIDRLDLEAAVTMFSQDVELMTVFGGEGTGIDQARSVLAALLGELRATHHEIASEWHPEPGIWIAEGTATYELNDFSQRGPFQRLIVVHEHEGLITQLRIYGAHELPLTESQSSYREVLGPRGWLPTL